MKHRHRMKVDTQKNWLNRADTQRLLALEGNWLGDWMSQLYGRHILYSGIDQNPKFLLRSPAQHCFRLGMPWQQGLVDVQAQVEDDSWPLEEGSLDVVVLQHCLDMTIRPHQMIREATRSLVPGGYLIIAGFNPYSWWGGIRALRTLSSTRLPWISNPVSPGRLTDWLTLLDFRLESLTSAAHLWPVQIGSEKASRRVDRVMAGSWLPGNVYILVARKTVAGMTTIRPKLKKVSEPRLGFAMPAARVADNPVNDDAGLMTNPVLKENLCR